ncbi:diaminopimelate decarboxylase [Tepidimicrobium xylanilyticum]|uniref:Diaminopimelate decarboxylase n=1 Tax=Tepidimicrobium xylanilyticum TaxID=1123352 RepID=A0A1H2VFT0_9FIRM|nr:diaminopimelate decarboxylase [Tepidimicrobium xylanilyticum]SDW67203.1 diaminopimelate decarboxylase [Tepidimicrobium xylanilyticum]
MTNFKFAGVDTVYLANKYKTPLYVMSENMILDRINEIKTNFLEKYENTEVFYASKAFLTKEMARIIKSEKLGIDVVSGGELYTVMQVDFPPEKIIFHGNNKTEEELEKAIKYGVGRIIVDNLYELSLLNNITQRYNKKINVLFRVTPGVDSNTHKYIQTGQIDSKFGIPLSQGIIFEAIENALKSTYIGLLGFHFHIGSQIFDKENYIKAIKNVVNLMAEAKNRFGFITKELNIGGGYGIKYIDKEERKPISYYTDAFMEEIEESCNDYGLERPKVIIEPGRWIVGEAGITLYTIGAIKEIPGVRIYASVDGGMTDNPRPSLYQAEYKGIIANKADKEPSETVTIAGKCCESGDILIWNLKVPPIESGDILAVLSTGAYNYSMASNYNKIPKPAVVMIKDGVDRLIVKRESYEDMIKNEL